MENKKVLLIDRKVFLEWFFSDDIAKDFFYTQDVLSSLINEGKFSITAEEVLDGCGYIPLWVVLESERDSVKTLDDDSEDVDTSYYDEIKFA